jgi:hypothetical protein
MADRSCHDLRARLAAIEQALDAGRYRVGAWATFLELARYCPRAERLAVEDDVTRVSARLHRRGSRRVISLSLALGLELAAVLAGGALLVWGRNTGSDAAMIGALLLWVTSFQPLLKVGVGTALGVRYEYAYLLGVEARFKMRYGSYLATPRWARILLHLSGCVGSPLGGWLVARFSEPLPFASTFASNVAWVLLAVNGALFSAALAGIHRLGGLRLDLASGGAAALELREGLSRRDAT